LSIVSLNVEIQTIIHMILQGFNFSKMNQTEIEFNQGTEKILAEKIVIGFIWILVETLGNSMLFGMVQFDRLGGDPLKRRIVDQVSFTK